MLPQGVREVGAGHALVAPREVQFGTGAQRRRRVEHDHVEAGRVELEHAVVRPYRQQVTDHGGKVGQAAVHAHHALPQAGRSGRIRVGSGLYRADGDGGPGPRSGGRTQQEHRWSLGQQWCRRGIREDKHAVDESSIRNRTRSAGRSGSSGTYIAPAASTPRNAATASGPGRRHTPTGASSARQASRTVAAMWSARLPSSP